MAKKAKKEEISCKTVDEALAFIKKRFGKDSVRRLSDNTTDHNIKVISTGSLWFDAATGIGGLPRGRVIEIKGPEGSGKCLVDSTYITTNSGVFTIKEIFEREGVKAACSIKESEVSVPLINMCGKEEFTKTFTNNGRKKTFVIKTSSGMEIQCTANHPHLIIDKNGFLVWKKTQYLEEGDSLATYRGVYKRHKISKEEKDVAYFLGLMLADAHLDKNRLLITNDDPDILNFLFSYLKNGADNNNVPINYKVYDANNSKNIHISSKIFVDNFYKKFGYYPMLSKDKFFSYDVRNSSVEFILNVIKGYMDCEMYISSEKNEIEVVSASKALLIQLKIILQTQFGIISTLQYKNVKGYEENDYYRLYIRGEEVHKYFTIIGTDSSRRHAEFLAIETETYNTNIDSIPNLGSLLKSLYLSCGKTTRKYNRIFTDYVGDTPLARVTYKRLHKILQLNYGDLYTTKLIIKELKYLKKRNYFYDSVVSVSEAEALPTFDFEMTKTHSFIANGIVTHNTSLALHSIAEVNKNNESALFVDIEHALDPMLAKNIGVDPNLFAVSQPDCAEDALDMMVAGVESGKFGVVVLDSVAALSPRAEIEGDVGDSQVGLQARLMGKALRKLTGIVSKTNTLVIFINQIRQKIGIMFGNPETTSGGNALKFFASMRVDIRAGDKIKSGENIVGNQVTIKIIKNKLAIPYKIIKTDFIYGHGFNKEKELLEAGEEREIVVRKGPKYYFNKILLGNKKDEAYEALRSDPVLFNEIFSEVKKIGEVKKHEAYVGKEDEE